MDREEIISKFFGKEKLLTREALDFLEARDAEPFLERDYIGTVLAEKDFFFPSIRVIKNLEKKPKEILTEDFLKFYGSKYEKMKNIIMSRIQRDFVSLNKVSSIREGVTVIGIAKEIKERDNKTIVELEDLTTTKNVIFDEPVDLELDDVVAIEAVGAGEILYGKKILYPDIPLRPPARGFGKACFISDLHINVVPGPDVERFFSWFEKQDINYLFVAGDIVDKAAFEEYAKRLHGKTIFVIPGESDNQEDYPQLPQEFKATNIISLSNPSMIEINGIKILLVHNTDASALKKRYLGRSKVILPEDYLVLEEVPDIVHCGHTHKPHVVNYKSVTIVNSGSLLTEFKPVVVDFSTRETMQETI